MSKLSYTILENKEEINIYGLRQKSNDKTQSKDISVLSKEFYKVANKKGGEVLPFFVVSKDYNEITKDFELLIGGLLKNDNLQAFTIPRGVYAKVTVKPKIGFLWGLSIGEAKRFFYTKWLPKHGYTANNMEYEYHTEVSIGKHPQIDILFSIRKVL